LTSSGPMRVVRTYQQDRDRDPVSFAEAARGFFPDVPRAILAAACARYKTLDIWKSDPMLPPAGHDRLLSSLVSGGPVHPGSPFSFAVEIGVAAAAAEGAA
jgi:hypothetical protein